MATERIRAKAEAEGWEVLAQDWRLGRFAIPVIARKDGVVAFIASTRGGAVPPARTREQIERAAWTWILKHGTANDRYRFDTLTPNGVWWIPEAWIPGWR